MDFCICISIGCPKNYSQEGDGSVHLCPRCHNNSVTATKETKCLQICFIDLVPLGTKHLWMCSICQYRHNGAAPPMGQLPQFQQQQQFQQPYPPQPYGQQGPPQHQSYEHQQHQQNQAQYQQNSGMQMQQGFNGQAGYNPGYK